LEIRYLSSKTLAGGAKAYYWSPPTKFKKRGCPYVAEALGQDLAAAVVRAEELNKLLDAWRAPKGEQPTVQSGTLAWLRREYEKHEKFRSRRRRTRENYERALDILESYKLESGALFKGVTAAKLRRRHVRKMQEVLTERHGLATSNLVMRVGRLLWNFAIEELEYDAITRNPFAKLDLKKLGGNTYAVTRQEAYTFIAKADELGHRSMGTAVMLAFELCQRESDVIGLVEDGELRAGITWACYKSPKDFGVRAEIQVRQSKTDELIWVPLFETDAATGQQIELIPGLADRLDQTQRRGSLIVMRDTKDKRKKVHLPYKEDWFRHLFRKIARAAGLSDQVTFMGMRHGGLTELGDAGATDREMMSVSGHTTPHMLSVYSRPTAKAAANAARKRRALRFDREQAGTKTG
jgi:hypothetical protein